MAERTDSHGASLRTASVASAIARTPPIGGPGTCLPPSLESVLAWTLCVSCLTVSGYHYVASTVVSPAWARARLVWRRCVRAFAGDGGGGDDDDEDLPYRRWWIPLTTHGRAELDRATPRERLDQLVEVLDRVLPGENKKGDDNDDDGCYSDDVLVRTIRTDEVCRRLASLAMRPYTLNTSSSGGAGRPTTTNTTTLLDEAPELELVRQLARLWPALLVLPPVTAAPAPEGATTTCSASTATSAAAYPEFEISLVLPAFREDGNDIVRKLESAREACTDPALVEVVLVDAGGCRNLDAVVETPRRNNSSSSSWGRVRKIHFASGGGRGPCLNAGARGATGRILTFCHSDTRLPDRWDVGVRGALFGDSVGRGGDGVGGGGARSSSCAFSFGIDAGPAGLNGGPYPLGIVAVETTANLRTHLFSLPYGDQCLSLPADVFRFLGGFPDQCLFEDFELVALLRRRAALLPGLMGGGFADGGAGGEDRERVTIIGGDPALCSPRRWQKFGVLYVTYTNSKLVNLYAGGMSPDDLFGLYYGASPPPRDSDLSPWEVAMNDLLCR